METAINIPTSEDWTLPTIDGDVAWLQRLFEGKSHLEVQRCFAGNFTERMQELLYAPRPVFLYYIQSASLYVLSENEDVCEVAAAASSFLNFVLRREERDPGSIKSVFPYIRSCVEYLASNQEQLDAPREIFGDFMSIAKQIQQAAQ